MPSLFPKQIVFFELLDNLGQDICGMAKLLAKSLDLKKIKETSLEAEKLEGKADSKTHEIIDRLNQTFITPFDREDIYQLAHELDDVVDRIEDVIHNIEIYQFTTSIKAMDVFVPLIEEATEAVTELLKCLKTQKYTPRLAKLKIRVHELEDDGDAAFDTAITTLFAKEKDPILVVKTKDIIEGLEDVLDSCQKVSNTIEGIVVKAS